VEEELLSTEEVAGYLGVGQVTVWRWCREGTLPCAKIGRSWRIRRSAVEEFVRRSERSGTLVDRLRTFLEESDNVLAIVQTRELMLRLNVAFFRVGDARGGILVKYRGEGRKQAADSLRTELERRGLEAAQSENGERLRFIPESGAPGRRAAELRRLVEEQPDGRSVWVNFDWEKRLPPEAALEQQRGITELTRDSDLVVMTNVLDPELDEWPGALQRRAHLMHSGAIWLSDAGLALSRVAPLPAL
jgi:excisionase family DNA binding protein